MSYWIFYCKYLVSYQVLGESVSSAKIMLSSYIAQSHISKTISSVNLS